MKVGIIRCQQTEDMCVGSTCLKVAAKGEGAFEEIGESKVAGFVSCGGCPGKRAVSRAAMMVKMGAEAIALASCITKGTPIGFVCPHVEQMKAAIIKKVGPDIKILDYSHK
ncbi:CGGC domain-containing protein [Porphyromonadaceae bacterium OttesenSCG-928-L07]|nr:CGGC domain-containing protein [Porphyromonadaceae bacterium OttesenSCG-928-L07]MDL2251483.1 CGGC domain-containing protein [Odoribacter sp. OttesenSCG-928-J03]MDL2282980.1 CGGC domain-containing protein [Odoribacter sp. OttesenSCG-928-G04]MDL2331296.1 CGGC domain-containing protein [Odoribacter sp. OttesenSCG-928-A06]